MASRFTNSAFIVCLVMFIDVSCTIAGPLDLRKSFYEVTSFTNDREVDSDLVNENKHVNLEIILEEDISTENGSALQMPKGDIGSEILQSNTKHISNKKTNCFGPVTLMAMCF